MEKLGKYKIIEELGKGAMGIVYKARDPDIDRDVAIKTIRFDTITEGLEKDELMKRFMKEAQAAGRLSHPNIITIYDVARENDLTYIVMQLVEGHSLKELIDSGKQYSPYEIIDIITKICDALDYAHQRGIVHRDMKPGNILIEKSGKPFIVDFGVARVETSTMTQTGQTLGTPSYMSPEQVMGQKIDGRSDIFSVGVILYELLTGQRPFSAEGGITTLIFRIVNEPPIPLSKVKKNVSIKFEPIIEKALAKSPDERYQNCRELTTALEPLKGVPEKTLTLKLSKDELFAKEAKKKPKLGLVLGIALSAIVIIGGGASYLLFMKGGKTPPLKEVQQTKLQETQVDTKATGVLPSEKLETPMDTKVTPEKDTKEAEVIPPVTKPPTTEPKEEKPKTGGVDTKQTQKGEIKKPEEKPKTEPEITKQEEKPKTPVTPQEKPEEKKEEPKTTIITPDPLEGLIKRLKDSYLTDNYEETRSIAKEVLAKDSSNAVAQDYLNRAEAKISASQKLEAGIKTFSSGDYPQTVLIMEEILRLDPQNKQAQQYLNLAKGSMKDTDDKAIRDIVERQRMAEEEEELELLLSDYSQSVKDKRLEEIKEMFKYYNNIRSRIDSISVTFADSRHAKVTFLHEIVGVFVNTGQKGEIFSGATTLLLEKRGKTWIITDYK